MLFDRKMFTYNAVSITYSLISLGSLTLAASNTSSDRVDEKKKDENDNDDDVLCL